MCRTLLRCHNGICDYFVVGGERLFLVLIKLQNNNNNNRTNEGMDRINQLLQRQKNRLVLPRLKSSIKSNTYAPLFTI